MGLSQSVPDVLIVNAQLRDMEVGTFLSALRDDPRFAGMVCVVVCPNGLPDFQQSNWPESVAVLLGPLRLDWLQGLVSGLKLLRGRLQPFRS